MINDIKSNIQDMLNEPTTVTTGLSIEEMHNVLCTFMGPLNFSLIRQAVISLVNEEVLEQFTDPQQANEAVYRLKIRSIVRDPQQLSFDDYLAKLETRDQIEYQELAEHDLWLDEEGERAQASLSVLAEIAAGHAREAEFAEEIRKASPIFAGENPVELLLEMAQWVVDDLNNLAAQIAIVAQSNVEEVRRLTRELGFRRKKAVRFFQRLWRFDAPTEDIQGIMFLPTVQQMGRRVPIQATFDIDRARARLNERVFGEHVIEVVTMPENMHRAAIGTDASVGDVRVKHEEGSFIPPTPAVLFVASAAMHSRDQNSLLPYWDFDIEPRELERYEDVEAAEEGLLISPRLRREVITDFRHLRSAAMELRQYRQELRVMRNDAEWRPIGSIPELNRPPEITLVIRDGRLFPLVHRLDDYDGASAPDDVLYGTVVRREIEAFHEVFLRSAGQGRLAPIYGGTVKSPEFSWFAMLTFWYLHVKLGQPEMADGFYRPILNDQAVTHLLFWGLAEHDSSIMSNPRNVMLTFRAVRRFSDIAFQSHPLPLVNGSRQVERLVDESNEDDWISYMEQHIEDANERYYKFHKRGVPPLETVSLYRPFLDLCRRAGVAMFYGVPARMYQTVIDSRAHFLSPRWEVAVEVTGLSVRNLNEKVEKMFAWLVEEGGLVRDESHAVADFEEVEEGLPLFIPDVVMEAHETVVFTKQRHIPDVEEMLRQLIWDIRNGNLPLLQ